MESVKRPLSPHLQIYKPQLTSILSITHRGTGVFLSLGALYLTCWLVGLASSVQSFNEVHQHLTTWYGKLFITAFTFSIFYHLCNGVRHLFWDIGIGLDISTSYKTGYAAIAVSIVLTLIVVFLGGVL